MSKEDQGRLGYHSGLAAERCVARQYLRAGYSFAAHRFRAGYGEIDLIMRKGGEVIFVEVKQSKTHASAAMALSGRQAKRILDTAQQFIAGEPAGQDTSMRFDVALVDQHGQVEVLENALAA